MFEKEKKWVWSRLHNHTRSMKFDINHSSCLTRTPLICQDAISP